MKDGKIKQMLKERLQLLRKVELTLTDDHEVETMTVRAKIEEVFYLLDLIFNQQDKEKNQYCEVHAEGHNAKIGCEACNFEASRGGL